MAGETVRSCLVCGATLAPAARGRRPRYCSRACQARAYRARLAERAGRREQALRQDTPAAGRAPIDAPGETGPQEAGTGREADGRDALSLDRIVRAALEIADREGLEALSMRRVAAALGAGTMSLYRHVSGKDDLVDLMAEAVLERAEVASSAAGPDGWRERLAAYARAMWALYRRHPWLLQVLSATRPRLVPRGMATTEWLLRAAEGLSHDPPTMVRAVVTVTGYVQGMAMFLVNDMDAERRTGIAKERWWELNRERWRALATSGPYPLLARIAAEDQEDVGLDEEFEFGLQRMLDGLALHLGTPPAERRP
ncbi:hypothetical protein GCM10010106_02240 [Thermopolyspora flexuosa]|jgi:AcrR family transcriptional regulator|uniref:TetR family transcriptional regulator n=1 Tax=Thermopolyspora flexuosa TaxID=103836 RepID=A0A543IY67_9ACTN|nr:TetR/AcrR family transcriptional regulator C-terminal domain-containing protein [Thermopolyspora flexuosa]TQM75522.1 TetR family transcriptional regulator [Thermopolyspora flexuosa]GGM60066.1 hypothetical protein GCM10010106_02240 [Thermopolyspora flexuosa]